MPQKLDSRLRLAESVINGTHPHMAAMKYTADQANRRRRVDSSSQALQQPLIELPEKLSDRQIRGNFHTRKLRACEEPMRIYDGYQVILATDAGPFNILFDTKTDPFLSAIIEKGRELLKRKPSMSVFELIFSLSALCFGNWKQEKQSLFAFETNSDDPTLFYFGEFIWRIPFSDLDCSMFSLALQVVLQPFLNTGEIPHYDFGDFVLYLGKNARFSPADRGAGEHAWNVVTNSNGEKHVIDLALFPETLGNLFQLVKKFPMEELYRRFCEQFFGYPRFFLEKNPPSLEDHDRMLAGDGNLNMLSTRNMSCYYDDNGVYLGSCRIPTESNRLA